MLEWTEVLTRKLVLPIWPSPKRLIFKETRSDESLSGLQQQRSDEAISVEDKPALPPRGDEEKETVVAAVDNCLYRTDDFPIQQARNRFQIELRYHRRIETRQRILLLILKWNIFRQSWVIFTFMSREMASATSFGHRSGIALPCLVPLLMSP